MLQPFSRPISHLEVLFLKVAGVVRVTHKYNELQASVSPPWSAALPMGVVGLDKLHPHASQVDQHRGNFSPVLPRHQTCHLLMVLGKVINMCTFSWVDFL